MIYSFNPNFIFHFHFQLKLSWFSVWYDPEDSEMMMFYFSMHIMFYAMACGIDRLIDCQWVPVGGLDLWLGFGRPHFSLFFFCQPFSV